LPVVTSAEILQIPIQTVQIPVAIFYLFNAAIVLKSGKGAAVMYAVMLSKCLCLSKLPGEKTGQNRPFFQREDFIHHNKNTI
jgi:hypothetical protein